MRIRMLLLFVGLVCTSLTASATIVTFTSLASWQAAVGNVYATEPFGATLQPFTAVVTTQPGLTGQTAQGFLTGNAPVWRDYLTTGESTTFSYKPGGVTTVPLYGAAGNWDTTPNTQGTGIRITLNLTGGGTAVVETSLNTTALANSFFGWTSTVPFSSFTLTSTIEHYDLDNLRLASTVPEPATFMLLGSALIGLGLLRRRK
jgi:hypothetical protein